MFGRETSSLYEETTPVKLARTAGFDFSNTLRNIKLEEDTVLIRYGLTGFRKNEHRFYEVINHSRAIINAMHKLRSSLILERADIPVPTIFISRSEIKQKDLPVIRRLELHSRGTDIVLVKSLSNIPHGDYYSKFVDNIAEYRVHVFNGEVIRVQKKVPTEEEHWIHNVSHGYDLRDTFKHNIKIENSIFQDSISAVDCLDLNFGAVDILVSKDSKHCILEVNTAPRLNRFGRELYSIYLNEHIENEIDILSFPRIRENIGRLANGLPVKYRDIKKKEEE